MRILADNRTARRRCSTLLSCVFLLLGSACWGQVSLAFEPPVVEPPANATFESGVASVLIRRCLECHNPRVRAGGLQLNSLSAIREGGESGSAIVVDNQDDVEDSELMRRILSKDDDRMPPDVKGESQRLPAGEIALLRRWLAGGAKWPQGRVLSIFEKTTDVRGGLDWWSLQPLANVSPPSILAPAEPSPAASSSTALRKSWKPENPIDAFVLKRLEEAKLGPAPIADRRTRIRRLYFDMLGAPPSFQTIQAFEQDTRPDAWERLVDRVLASPQYGQRWARYWLDLVRYADTSGYERDQPKPFAWRYRDWVIDAHNNDLPYDQFLVQQLAGDQIAKRTRQSVIATGFLRLGTWNDEPNDPQDYKYERLEDLVHSTSSAFLGLTVKCARCHDHKFDPIPQHDYYRMAAVFWPGPIQPRDRKLLGGPSESELGEKNVLGWTDLGASPSAPLHLLKDGDRHKPQQAVVSGGLSFVPDQSADFKAKNQRLQLASWMVRPDNPLVARVMANRLWLHHFGQGLVRTPNNFGFTGDPPTHPELLDWLAAELLRQEWRLKPIHRLLLTSRTYQQRSVHPQELQYRMQDAGNRLWWRANRRRMDAESLRDSLLAVSGELDVRMTGPGFRPTISPEASEGLSRKASAWKASPPRDQLRRSVYLYSQRSLLPPWMTAFDFSDTTLPCAKRDSTTVAPQALAMMNHRFQHQRSTALARRVMRSTSNSGSGSNNLQRRIEAIWKLALGRLPKPEEVEAAAKYLQKQRPRFDNTSATEADEEPAWRRQTKLVVRQQLVLHLAADRGVVQDSMGGVEKWEDQSGQAHHALQLNAAHRPKLSGGDNVGNREEGPAALFWDGNARYMKVEGALLSQPECSIFIVASDLGPAKHRGLISNWNGAAGNSTSSVFLGLTAERSVRFSDQFAPAGEVARAHNRFLLTAVNGAKGAFVYQNANPIAARPQALSGRRLDTPWVIGQQGNINGEYWRGEIAEVLVYDRALADKERQQVWGYLLNKYGLSKQVRPTNVAEDNLSPELLLWSSLCQVVLNSNEFLYID